MKFEDMREIMLEWIEEDEKAFIKALISVEKDIDDEEVLDAIYESYINDDLMGLLDENFDYLIEELTEK